MQVTQEKLAMISRMINDLDHMQAWEEYLQVLEVQREYKDVTEILVHVKDRLQVKAGRLPCVSG